MGKSTQPPGGLLVTQLRGWLIEKAIGLIDETELKRRADAEIANLETPPDYLIKVSIGEPLDHVPGLDLTKEGIALPDCALITSKVAQQYRQGAISLEFLGRFADLMREALGCTDHGPDRDFVSISATVSLVTDGVIGNREAETSILELLTKISGI